MANLVQFGRGSQATYESTWEGSLQDYIYFATDTQKIYLNGVLYGGDGSSIVNVEYTAPNTLTFTTADGDTVNVVLQTAQAGDSAADSTGGTISAEDIYKLYELGDEVEALETTVEELEQALEDLTIKKVVAADETITVTETDDEYQVAVNISGDSANIISAASDGLFASVKVVTTSSSSSDVSKSYKVVGIAADGTEVDLGGETIDILKDQFLQSVEVGTIPEGQPNAGDSALVFTFITSTGEEQVVYLDINTNIWEAETGAGLTYNDDTKKVEVKIDGNSESYISVSEDGVLISGIDDAISSAIAASAVEVEAAEGSEHITVTSSTGSEGQTVYTIAEDNIASQTDLDETNVNVTTLTEALTWQDF